MEAAAAPPGDADHYNPFSEMDDDHSLNYDAMHDLMNFLPPGWRRLTPEERGGGDDGPARPPYLHEPTGDTSWRNPNLREILGMVDERRDDDAAKRKAGNSGRGGNNKNGTDRSRGVKKLRLMLQAGAPLGAVEQKAKIEGVNMDLVLSPQHRSSGSDDDEDGKDASSVVLVSDVEDSRGGGEDDANAAVACIPETLVKKYRRMLKAGVPFEGVHQLAMNESGASAEEVTGVLRDVEREGKKKKSEEKGGDVTTGEGAPSASNPRVEKFLRMQRAGIPLIAIQNAARLQGHNMNEVNDALGVNKGGDEVGGNGGGADTGVAGSTKPSEPKRVHPRMNKFLSMQRAGVPLGAIINSARLDGFDVDEVGEALGVASGDGLAGGGVAVKEANKNPKVDSGDEKVTGYFTVQDGGNVSFPSSSGSSGQNNRFPLTDLVRKMSQTVQKTSRFSVGSGKSEMVVTESTLFHALGAIKGVQFARREYNSTVGANGMEIELVHAKRHGFVEMATSIGMALPNEGQADILGLDELVDHIDNAASEKIDAGNSLLEDGFYEFDTLHALYPPGAYVVAKHAGGSGIDCVCQVVWHRYTEGKTVFGKPMRYFQLCCRYIVPVGGGKSTFAEVVEGIEMWEGRRSLSASESGAGLAFVPVSASELEGVLLTYLPRGEMYNQIVCVDEEKTHSYMEYEKGCFFQKCGSGAGKSSVALATSGRIVVDFDAASDNGHSISIGRDDMIDGIRMKLKEYKLHLRLVDNRRTGAAGGESKGAGGDVSAGSMVLFSEIPKDYLPFVWPTTVGFSLTSKAWGDVVIGGLKGIIFDPAVFDLLVLPPSRKRMIKALVKHTSSSGFHDLVQGKGEGTCFLLYGPPGTGKTLTAEAISEHLNSPLYSLSMGTLGTTADELERRLSEILDLSARWGALVLLDECDAFLEARSSNSSLERNAMVSVILRLVEYHRGILFLTSNRIESLDPAFQTRITLALNYEPLDLDGRVQVWENLILKSGQSLDSLDLNSLSKFELNGREIKNALRLAMALAAEEGGELTQELLLETAAMVNGNKVVEKDTKPRGLLSFLWG